MFLDLKLHDIGNTVEEGVQSLTRMNPTFLTVHAYPQTMRGAVEGRGQHPMGLLAVTALTSYDDADLHDAGYRLAVADLVALRAQQARLAGIDGVVCSAAEAGIVRNAIGSGMVIVTPGIRQFATNDDQKRVKTFTDAINDGADFAVIGRPIIQAKDRIKAVREIIGETETTH